MVGHVANNPLPMFLAKIFGGNFSVVPNELVGASQEHRQPDADEDERAETRRVLVRLQIEAGIPD